MPPSGLLVVHDSVGGGENNVSELTGRKEVDDPLLNFVVSNVEPGGHNPALVDPTVELNNDLARPVVIDDLDFLRGGKKERKEREERVKKRTKKSRITKHTHDNNIL